MTTTYCETAPGHPWHGHYHDTEYGFPARDDRVLFERLALEINQAGLSWLTVLKKRQAFSEAFRGFDPRQVAEFGEEDRERLLNDPAIIRNRLKINAVIVNAGRILEIRESHGSFADWIDAHHPLDKSEWVKLFRKTFRFMGPEIVGEFLMSTGYLPGAHHADCPIQARVLKARPAWLKLP